MKIPGSRIQSLKNQGVKVCLTKIEFQNDRFPGKRRDVSRTLPGNAAIERIAINNVAVLFAEAGNRGSVRFTNFDISGTVTAGRDVE